MDYTVHGVTESWTQLSDFHFHGYIFPKSSHTHCIFTNIVGTVGSGTHGLIRAALCTYTCVANKRHGLEGLGAETC